MKKLNKDQQVKVEATKKAITKLQEAELIIYSHLIQEINEDNDWIYDYIFNCTEENEYTNTVRNKIFE